MSSPESGHKSPEDSLSPLSPLPPESDIPDTQNSNIQAIVLSVWDNILGPRTQHVWRTQCQEPLPSGIVPYISNHTLSGEICRCGEEETAGTVDSKFYILPDKNIISSSFIFTGRAKAGRSVYALSVILPSSKLKAYLPWHDLCEARLTKIIMQLQLNLEKNLSDGDVLTCLSASLRQFVQLILSLQRDSLNPSMDLSESVFASGKERMVEEGFLRRAIISHLQTLGCSVVYGKSDKIINKVIHTLAAFLSPTERQRSRVCVKSATPHQYEADLFLQGIIEDKKSAGLDLPMFDVLTSRYPTSLINLTNAEVRQTPPFHVHSAQRHEILTLQMYTDGEENPLPDMSVFELVDTDESFVQTFLAEVFQLHPSCGVREAYIENFCRMLERKALALIKYLETETERGQQPLKISSLKRIRNDLSLKLEGDFCTVLAVAEKMKAGVYNFWYHSAMHSTEQLRDTLVSL
ncbi:guanine nucleotide exchange C9orf72-like [Branchiostoma floridae]|uniref:Guanine nucleotide exchange C9orf72-like n=1 Tax=Branchiostoma floridae TaxID=7739 RepID=A0A9J7MF41_BRAFL|nr:guanine nucleotide exchange C9orf72-like [Branchiostoma floridae]